MLSRAPTERVKHGGKCIEILVIVGKNQDVWYEEIHLFWQKNEILKLSDAPASRWIPVPTPNMRIWNVKNSIFFSDGQNYCDVKYIGYKRSTK